MNDKRSSMVGVASPVPASDSESDFETSQTGKVKRRNYSKRK